MYLFSRRAQIAPGQDRKAGEWAVEIAGVASRAGGLPIATWASILSPAVGEIVWSMMAPSMEVLHAATLATLADDKFTTMVEAATDLWMGAPTDVVGEILYGGPNPNGPPTLAMTVRADAVPGRLGAALTFGAEIAVLNEQITGASTLFGRNVTGSFGGASWISGYASAAQLDEANGKLHADERYLAALDRVGEQFLPGAESQILQRLG